jgi:hypothetical protein
VGVAVNFIYYRLLVEEAVADCRFIFVRSCGASTRNRATSGALE